MAKAFALPLDFDLANGTGTQMKIVLRIAAGDGVNPPQFFAGSFVFDASLTAAQNLANLKTSVVNQCTANGLTLVSTDVSVFTAIN